MGTTTVSTRNRNDAYLNCDHRMKLTDTQVAEIRARYLQGSVRQQDLALEYGVSQTAVSLIVRYKSRWTGPRSPQRDTVPARNAGVQRQRERGE